MNGQIIGKGSSARKSSLPPPKAFVKILKTWWKWTKYGAKGRIELAEACEVRSTSIDMKMCFPEAIGTDGIHGKARGPVLAMPQHKQLQK